MPVLSARDESSTMRPIYIAGFAVVGAIVLAVSIWLAIRFYRHRALKKRDNMRNAAFLSVKGLVSDDSVEKDFTTNGFSRTHLTRSVVLPDRALRTTPQEIAEFHRQSGNFPRPFAPSSKPFTFPLSPPDRSSLFSTGSGSRLSVLSTISTTSVTSIDPSSPTSTRKVRQTYTPILPDELLIAPSERLMVVQSFDDGWCVVGRPLPNKAAQPKSLFKTPFPSDVELGVVPAWCFLKHVKAERPVRSSSLGITVQMDLDGPGVKRDDLVSWSNF